MCCYNKLFFINNNKINIPLENMSLNSAISLFGFYGISTFEGYLMPNPFSYK